MPSIFTIPSQRFEPAFEGHGGVGFTGEWEFYETKWITIPINHQTCLLTEGHNWKHELHPDIIGGGTVQDPLGALALHPRYYVKKRLTTDNKVQFAALLNPLATPVSINNPDRFRTQLVAIFCQHGKIEAIDAATRVFRAYSIGWCDIEENLMDSFPQLITL